MKGEEGKIKKHRKRKGRVNWLKRSLAVCLAAATLMTGVGLESVFADEAVSTGKIETQQSAQTEVQTQAETGEADENTAAANAADPADHNNAPESVTTGEEADKAEAADEGQTTDVINSTSNSENNGNAASTGQSESNQSTNVTPASDEKEQQSNTPKAVELSVLKRSLKEAKNATNSPEIPVYQYADESITVNLLEGTPEEQLPKFEGGSLTEGDTEGIPDYSGAPARIFKRAAFVYEGAEDYQVWLTGLYPYKNADGTYDWYYTTEKTDDGTGGSTTDDPLGNVEAGFLLPDKTKIHFYYGLLSDQEYQISASSESGDIEQWQLGIAGATGSGKSYTAKEGARIVVTMTLQDGWRHGEVSVKGGGLDKTYGLYRGGDGPGSSGIEKAELLDSDTNQYQFMFVMPKSNVQLSIKGISWEDDGDNKIWFGLWSTESANVSNGEYGATRFFTISKQGGDTGSPTYPQYTNRPGASNGFGGFGNYSTGGKPYYSKEAYFMSDSGSTQFAQKVIGNVVGASSVGSDGLTQSVINPDNPSSFANIPIGEMAPGGKAQFRLDTSRGQRINGTTQWLYVPAVLHVDVYKAGGQYQSTNFDRHSYTLPKAVGETIDERIPGGGHIKIECKAVNNVDATGYNGEALKNGWSSVYGNKPGWYTYNITVSGIVTDFKLVYENYSTAQTHYYVSSLDGTREGSWVDKNMGGANKERVDGDYIQYFRGRDFANGSTITPGALGYYPLTEGLKIDMDELLNSKDIYLGADVREGFSKPEISITGNAKWSIKDEGFKGPDDDRYSYTVTFTNNGKNTNNAPAGRIHMTSEPVKFQINYSYQDNTYETAKEELQYDKLENYIVQPYLPQQGLSPGLKGFELQVVDDEDNVVATIPYHELAEGEDAAGGETLWLPGTLINVRKLYQYLRENQYLKAGVVDYKIQLIAKVAQNGESMWLVGGIGYTMYRQTSWFEFNDPNASYDSSNFGNSKEYWVDGYKGNAVVFSNYPESFIDPNTSERYVLAKDKSISEGIANEDKSMIGRFYYLNAVSAEVQVPAEVLSAPQYTKEIKAKIDDWNTKNQSALYTGVNGRKDNTIAMPDVTMPKTVTTTSGEKQWVGWKISKHSGTITGSGNYEYFDYEIADGTKSLDLYQIGKTNLDTWNGIFGSGAGTSRKNGVGSVVLIPVYESSKIESINPADLIQENPQVITYTGGDPDPAKNDGKFLVGGTFKYTGDATGLNDAFFAITKQEKQHRNGSSEIEKENIKLVGYGQLSISGNQISVKSGSTGGVYFENSRMQLDAAGSTVNSADSTFKLAFQKTSTADNLITYQWEDDAIYGVHAWGKGNSNAPDSVKLAYLADKSNGDATMSGVGSEIMSLFLDEGNIDIPGTTTRIQVQPKEIATLTSDRGQTGGSVQQIIKSDPLEIHAETNFEITAGFMIDENYPKDLQIGSSAAEDAKMHIALYKKNPGNDSVGWHSWAFDGRLTTGADIAGSGDKKTSTGSITSNSGSNGEATVTFPIYNRVNPNNGNPTVSWQWDDGAKYCIVAWNKSNTDNETFTDDTLKPEGTYAGKAPSVTTDIVLQWQESSYYVYIPADVVLTEDEAKISGGSEGYAGAEATIRYKNSDSEDPAEGNNEKDQPEVEVQVQDGVALQQTGGSKSMTMNIYGTDGNRRDASKQTDTLPQSGYVYIGLLTTDTQKNQWINGSETLPAGESFQYQINARINEDDAKDTTYEGVLNYQLTLRDYVRPTS